MPNPQKENPTAGNGGAFNKEATTNTSSVATPSDNLPAWEEILTTAQWVHDHDENPPKGRKSYWRAPGHPVGVQAVVVHESDTIRYLRGNNPLARWFHRGSVIKRH